jgi:ATP/ADP translocase
MTKKQRRLIYKWLIALTAFVVLLVFEDKLIGNAAWVRWVLFGGLIVAVTLTRSRLSLEPASVGMNQIVNTYPFIKLWLVVWGLVIAVVVVLVTHSAIRLEEIFGFRIIAISILLLVGPILWLSERERFRKYGEENDAI